MMRLVVALLALLWALLPAAPSALAEAAADTALTLTSLQKDVDAAGQLVAEKISEAAAAGERLRESAERLTEELRNERRAHGISAFGAALQVARIGYDVRLLQRLQGYAEYLDGRIAVFRSAQQVLEYHHDRLQDDLLMLRTLKHAEVDALSRQVQTDVEEIRSQARQPLLQASAVAFRSPEAIWNAIK
jgi:hypothetical protein